MHKNYTQANAGQSGYVIVLSGIHDPESNCQTVPLSRPRQ